MARGSLIVLAATLTGCVESRSFGSGSSISDSAGIPIVRSAEPEWAAESAWTVADTPRVDLGGRDGYQFGDIAGIVVTPAGAIAVADAGSQTVRVFDLAGRPLRTLGRRGTAPGEFQALSWIAAAGDSILAYDLVTRRLTMLGARTRTVTLQGVGPLLTTPLGRFEDGTVLVASGGPIFPFQGREGELRLDSAFVLRYRPDGGVSDTVARVPWSESFGVAIGRGAQQFLAPMPRPFGRRTTVTLVGDRIAIGRGQRYEVAVLAGDGKLERIVRRVREPLPVTVDAIAAFKEAQRRAEPGQGLQAQVDAALEAALDSAPYPESLPAYERLLADPAGHLWVLDYSIRYGQPQSWSVFDPGGRWLGTVQTPAGLRVEQVGDHWVIGVWRAPSGEQHVRMYEIRRDGGTAGRR